MMPTEVYELCRSDKSVTDEMVKNPTESPRKAATHLFDHDLKEDIEGGRLKDL